MAAQAKAAQVQERSCADFLLPQAADVSLRVDHCGYLRLIGKHAWSAEVSNHEENSE